MKMNKYLLAGAVATIPMTLVMSRLFENLPHYEKYPAPPTIITHNITKHADVNHYISNSDEFKLSIVNHFGFGAVAGAFFFPLIKRVKVNPVMAGALYGLGVWGVNYLGVLPALKLYPKVYEEPLERTEMMVTSHIVWGGFLGFIHEVMFRKQNA